MNIPNLLDKAMFTGIIECLGEIKSITQEGENFHFEVTSPVSNELKIDQSVSHNGVCLTVTAVNEGVHAITAIKETLDKTNLGTLQVGDIVNIERCMQLNGRFDGHIVQGHVDQVGHCIKVEDEDGSWRYTFEYDASLGNITVEKGSICINGTSLTVIDSENGKFSVAIIPYTFENTTFKTFQEGTKVNLEFDIVGKYLQKLFKQSQN